MLSGISVPQDYAKAASWLEKAADQGLPRRNSISGALYEAGNGVQQDDAQGRGLVSKSRRTGLCPRRTASRAALRSRRRRAAGLCAQAAGWYRKAALQELPEAEYNLGTLYERGIGVPQDYAQAADLYRRAAEKGNASAQFNLGLLYDNGTGVEKDYAQAAAWYTKAAEQGFPEPSSTSARCMPMARASR